MNYIAYATAFILSSVLILFLLWFKQTWRFNKHLKHVPYIKLSWGELFFGELTCAGLYQRLLCGKKEHGKIFWTLIGFEPMLFAADAKFSEVILSSPKFIDKSKTYNYFHNWLGTGLLTSTGPKWKSRRRILTPAFHFKILEDFVPSFDSASNVLVEKLNATVGGGPIDIFPYVTLCTLDAVCESAMGTTVNAQRNENSIYVQSVKEMCRILINRSINPLEHFEATFRFTKDHKLEGDAVKILHDYTNSVIRRRKIEMERGDATGSAEDADFGIKNRKAFLDLLLEYSKKDNLSDTDIREEVDTFMFEGHDTTASAITFCLYLLAKNPHCQEKAFAEIRGIFGEERGRAVTFADLHDMKYLELVLKEALRLFPSVPMYARELREDLTYGGVLLPKGLTVTVLAYVMHLDPDYFENPEDFDPERFETENVKGKNAFSYVPFSAGPRNCIGQKFAMLSMKSTVSKILRHYELLPVEQELELSLEAILKSRNGVKVALRRRC